MESFRFRSKWDFVIGIGILQFDDIRTIFCILSNEAVKAIVRVENEEIVSCARDASVKEFLPTFCFFVRTAFLSTWRCHEQDNGIELPTLETVDCADFCLSILHSKIEFFAAAHVVQPLIEGFFEFAPAKPL